MIKLEKINKTYHLGKTKVQAVKNVSLKIEAGEFVAITGPSGSGKSTMLHIIGLLDRPDSGAYLLFGKEVSCLSDEELASVRGNRMGFVFQTFNLLPKLNARENVELPLLYSMPADGSFYSPEEILEKVGLGNRLEHNPNELSGGERQRVAIARALVENPCIILADEPTGNLDSRSSSEIMEIFKNLNREGITVVMVTHEMELANQTNRIIKMKDGFIISDEAMSERKIAVSKKTSDLEIKRLKFNLAQAKNYFKHALKSLSSNKTRSFLSILGVLIGEAAVIAMLALGAGAREDIKQRLSHLGSNVLSVRLDRRKMRSIAMGSGFALRFTLGDANAIKRIPIPTLVSPTISGGAQVVYRNKNTDTDILGVAPDYEYIRFYTPVKGRFFNSEETTARAKVALIGKKVAEKIFGNDNPVGKTIKINRIAFRVIGELPEKGSAGWRDYDDQIIIPLNTAMYRLFGKKYVKNIEVKALDEKNIPILQREIKNLIVRRHKIPEDKRALIEVRNWAEIQEAISSTAKTFSWLLGSIAFISLLVGGIGIMNIMLVSVTERTREIGVRKAIGAKNLDILIQFIIETVAICLIGGIMGIMLGAVITGGLSKFAGWNTKISAFSISLAFLFSAVIGIFSGLWPARKAARLNPIDALRYE
ncbi:MAG: ABC transporter permease [Elusimicrobia bacterium]|nr:ABC transporter permease [Elusimicrobiota bacterium]